jgi:hypothetical protein
MIWDTLSRPERGDAARYQPVLAGVNTCEGHIFLTPVIGLAGERCPDDGRPPLGARDQQASDVFAGSLLTAPHNDFLNTLSDHTNGFIKWQIIERQRHDIAG